MRKFMMAAHCKLACVSCRYCAGPCLELGSFDQSECRTVLRELGFPAAPQAVVTFHGLDEQKLTRWKQSHKNKNTKCYTALQCNGN